MIEVVDNRQRLMRMQRNTHSFCAPAEALIQDFMFAPNST
uniref:Uncharacterized protein n=1 Tax=Rhizophora mucronata TaxID=61149 RepID=A0A2P2JGF9_RHIMU